MVAPYLQRHASNIICRMLLGLLTQCVGLESAPADDAAADAEECLVDVVADLPADAQAAEPVQQREGMLDDPTVGTQARSRARRCGER